MTISTMMIIIRSVVLSITGSMRRFLASHAAVHNTFAVQRHLVSRRTLRTFRAEATQAWQAATAAARIDPDVGQRAAATTFA
jgi:putative transposase